MLMNSKRTGIRERYEPLESRADIDNVRRRRQPRQRHLGKISAERIKIWRGHEAARGLLANAIWRRRNADIHSLSAVDLRFHTITRDLSSQRPGITAAPTTWAELDAAAFVLVTRQVSSITGMAAYMTNFYGYHLARLVGRDMVKEIVTNGRWDNQPFLRS